MVTIKDFLRSDKVFYQFYGFCLYVCTCIYFYLFVFKTNEYYVTIINGLKTVYCTKLDLLDLSI